MFKKLLAAMALACVALCSGCASIVNGQNQSVSVNTPGCEPAACTLTNEKGTWFVNTPGSVVVRRAYGAMAVSCVKEGFAPGTATIASATKGMAFGNILLGGVIGAGVDIGTGAAYDYPELITVSMTCGTAKSAGTTAPVAPAVTAATASTAAPAAAVPAPAPAAPTAATPAPAIPAK